MTNYKEILRLHSLGYWWMPGAILTIWKRT